jgi:hypothetical protein
VDVAKATVAAQLRVDAELFGVIRVMEPHANKIYFTKSWQQILV